MNKLLDRIDMLQEIDSHILLQKEGNVSQIAKQLGMSRRRIYVYFDLMKDLGAPVKYNFEKRRLEYQSNFRLSVKINTRPNITVPTDLYKKIKDVTLKRIILYNQIDECIGNENTGTTHTFRKTLKMKTHRICGNTLNDFRKMGAQFYFDRTKNNFRFRKGKRFNFILEVLPFKKSK